MQVCGVAGIRFRGAGCRMGWGGGGVEPATDAAAAAREASEPARNARVMRMHFIGGGHARVSIYLSIYLSIFLSFYLSIFLSIYVSIYRSIYLSIYL